MKRTLFSLTMLLLALPALSAADWPQFRGPDGRGISEEKNLPDGFDDKAGLRWQADLPGQGICSPVIVDGKVYVTASSGARDDRLHVLCFDVKTGKKLWHRQLLATGSTTAHPDTNMAAPTVAADKTGVYALFSTGDLASFDAEGNLRWYRSLAQDYPGISNQLGMASSIIKIGEKLIVPMDNAGDSFLVAVDTATGKNVWRINRPKEINWTTPTVRTSEGKAELILQGPTELAAYDPDTGEKVWTSKLSGSIPSPTVAGELLISPSGGVTVSKLGTGGPNELWKSARLQTGMTSPLYYNDRVYITNPRAGLVVCANAESGELLWEERVKGPFSGSPVAGDGKLYIVSEAGTLTVMKADDEPDILAQSELDDKCQSTPAIADGAVFVRTKTKLFCIAKD